MENKVDIRKGKMDVASNSQLYFFALSAHFSHFWRKTEVIWAPKPDKNKIKFAVLWGNLSLDQDTPSCEIWNCAQKFTSKNRDIIFCVHDVIINVVLSVFSHFFKHFPQFWHVLCILWSLGKHQTIWKNPIREEIKNYLGFSKLVCKSHYFTRT